MYTEYQNVQKFLDTSFYYFLISGRNAETVTTPEIVEILEIVNADHASESLMESCH